jgi:GST-like protein
MEKQLSSRDYLAGGYSIADIAAFPWARTWQTLGQDIRNFPHVERWLARIAERPAVIRGLELRKPDDVSRKHA